MNIAKRKWAFCKTETFMALIPSHIIGIRRHSNNIGRYNGANALRPNVRIRLGHLMTVLTTLATGSNNGEDLGGPPNCKIELVLSC